MTKEEFMNPLLINLLYLEVKNFYEISNDLSDNPWFLKNIFKGYYTSIDEGLDFLNTYVGVGNKIIAVYSFRKKPLEENDLGFINMYNINKDNKLFSRCFKIKKENDLIKIEDTE